MSATPQSAPAEPWAADFDQFVEAMRARLHVGALEYGDQSFDKPLSSLADEIDQELVDQANWSFIGFMRLQRTRRKIEELERRCAE